MSGFVFERFQNMSSEYDIVLIDAAPLLLSAETEYLARMADVTVLVSEAGTTKKAWLTRAARLLERLGVAGAAAIVNKVHPARVEDAMKHDLREFELRNDKVNLQDWWKTGKKSQPSPAAAPAEAVKDRADEEDVIYARDL
jgi:Mrp family chromosome partitioning ATPase